MLQAVVTHLCDSTSKMETLRNQSHRHLEACLGILITLKDMHSYAPYATDFLTSAATKLYRQSRAIIEKSTIGVGSSAFCPSADVGNINETGTFQATPPPSAPGMTGLDPDDWASLIGGGPNALLQSHLDYNVNACGDGSLDSYSLEYPHWLESNVDYATMNFNTGW